MLLSAIKKLLHNYITVLQSCIKNLINYLSRVTMGVWLVWVVFGAVALGALIFIIYRRSKNNRLGIKKVDRMNNKGFEMCVGLLLEKLGYRVEGVEYQKEYGTNLFAYLDGYKTAVLVKSHNSSIDVTDIKNAVAAKSYYRCAKALIVMSGIYGKQMLEDAKDYDIEIWDRRTLIRALFYVEKNGGAGDLRHLLARCKEDGIK